MVVNTSTSVPTTQDNVSSPHVQTGESNMSISHSQNIDTSTMRSNIESIAISYSNNQPTDPNL